MKKHITLLAALLVVVSAGAQSFQQAFFLDGYRLGYRYNPAFQNPEGFLSVGQWENQSRSNFGAASFLYPRDGEVLTALHPDVTSEEFLGSLNKDNYLTGNINFNLFSHGWRRDAAYHTIEANVRALYSANVPIEIFQIVKSGTSNEVYDLSGMNLNGNAIVELSYGYSRKLSDIVSVGARAKLLVGVESLNYRLSRMDLTLNGEKYEADLEADLNLTSRWRKIRSDEQGYMNLLDLSAKDRWRLPSGLGLALDLGVVVTPVEGLTLSAAVTDLGGMLWYYGNAGKSDGTAVFTGVKELSIDDIRSGNVMKQFNGVLNELLQSVRLKSVGSRTLLEAVPLNINLGAKYEMPFYRPLSVGVTGNYFAVRGMSYKEVRGALAWNHFDWLGLTANAGVGSYGPVWGFALNAAIKRFRLTVGYNDGFGGTVPYTSTALKANNKVVTVGLTYDL